ncbi:Crp/Fnr family transcriptional regulator [Lacihabitans sp. LS3-19]|uniref:Crp/Fnr family transcriptional regulator n=1 Tax=Lacihabitans sp. LS3-19 TaxID=2487335 RepID=UPI0020CFC990|nr:cyclic nucleotide-binding domain-containing protein [Lacihabitans sp. LS3-19]MCP9769098.1 Crp/Fnr family transcriptional regulator [Lacihabitans sp. LS3-19]
MDKFYDILKQGKLTEKDIELLQGIICVQNVKNNKIIVDYGKNCTNIYFILKGGFVMQLLKDDGSEKTINFFLEGFQPFMTVPQSFFRDVTSNCKLVSIRNSDVIVLPKKELLQILEISPTIKDFYQSQIITALLSELDFRTKLLSYSPKNMYELLISDYQEVIQNISSRHIANFIGISPEWLSNLKKTL